MIIHNLIHFDMIIKIEIQAFIKRIESKLHQLSGSNKTAAEDNINILNRSLIEMRESDQHLKRTMNDLCNSEIERGKMLLHVIELEKKLEFQTTLAESRKEELKESSVEQLELFKENSILKQKIDEEFVV